MIKNKMLVPLEYFEPSQILSGNDRACYSAGQFISRLLVPSALD
jgi:hypothetical protein